MSEWHEAFRRAGHPSVDCNESVADISEVSDLLRQQLVGCWRCSCWFIRYYCGNVFCAMFIHMFLCYSLLLLESVGPLCMYSVLEVFAHYC